MQFFRHFDVRNFRSVSVLKVNNGSWYFLYLFCTWYVSINRFQCEELGIMFGSFLPCYPPGIPTWKTESRSMNTQQNQPWTHSDLTFKSLTYKHFRVFWTVNQTIHTLTHTYTHIYTERERERERDRQTERPIKWTGPCPVQNHFLCIFFFSKFRWAIRKFNRHLDKI